MTQIYEGKLTLRQSSDDWDWWCIERAQHDGGSRFIPTGDHSARLDVDARLGTGDNNCDIEGSADEMLSIATAIENGKSAMFRRVAVYYTHHHTYEFTSPRNGTDHVRVLREHAAELAKEIREKVGAFKAKTAK